jgi:hypothetical protein
LRVCRVAAIAQRGGGEGDGAQSVAACPYVGHVRLLGWWFGFGFGLGFSLA